MRLTLCMSCFIAFSLFSLAASVCNEWTLENEIVLCYLAKDEDLFSFCDSKGPADEGCANVSAKVEGTSPNCSDAQVCSFVKDGARVYVTCKSTKKGYQILRNCVNDNGIACPDPNEDLSTRETVRKLRYIHGKGRWEESKFSPRYLCNETDPKSVDNCQSIKLRNDVISKFHKRQIGNLCGGFCSIIVEHDEDDGTSQEHNRCVMTGTYFNEELGITDRFRLHLSNHGKDIIIMGYWGRQAVMDPQATTKTP